MDVEVKQWGTGGVVRVKQSKLPNISKWNTTKFNHKSSLLRANQRGANGGVNTIRHGAYL